MTDFVDRVEKRLKDRMPQNVLELNDAIQSGKLRTPTQVADKICRLFARVIVDELSEELRNGSFEGRHPRGLVHGLPQDTKFIRRERYRRQYRRRGGRA